MPAEAAISPAAMCCWPQHPALPPCGQPALVRVATAAARPAARLELRTALKTLLAAWSGLPPECLPLQDTAQGPVWNGHLHGLSLDISLTYGPHEGLIGLIRGGRIGVDIMPVKPFAQTDDVARHYLNPVVAATLRQSEYPAKAFAVAWTQREARLKCLKKGLVEWTPEQEQIESSFFCQNVIISKHLMAAVCYR